MSNVKWAAYPGLKGEEATLVLIKGFSNRYSLHNLRREIFKFMTFLRGSQDDLSDDRCESYGINKGPGNCYEYYAKNYGHWLPSGLPLKFDLNVISKHPNVVILDGNGDVIKHGSNSAANNNFSLERDKIMNSLFNPQSQKDEELTKQGRWLSGVDQYSSDNYERPNNSPFKWL